MKFYIGVTDDTWFHFQACQRPEGISMKRNGSPEPTFETDDERTYFLAVLPVHPDMKERGQAGGEAKGEVRGEADKKGLNDTEKAILKCLEQGGKLCGKNGKCFRLKKQKWIFYKNVKGLN